MHYQHNNKNNILFVLATGSSTRVTANLWWFSLNPEDGGRILDWHGWCGTTLENSLRWWHFPEMKRYVGGPTFLPGWRSLSDSDIIQESLGDCGILSQNEGSPFYCSLSGVTCLPSPFLHITSYFEFPRQSDRQFLFLLHHYHHHNTNNNNIYAKYILLLERLVLSKVPIIVCLSPSHLCLSLLSYLWLISS